MPEGLGLKFTTDIQDLTLKSIQNADQVDPVFLGLGYVLGVILILIAITTPIISLVKSFKDAKTEAYKASAETALYEQLRAQIDKCSADISKLSSERDEWYRKALHLEREVERLKTFEQSVNSMRVRLDEKDNIIAKKDLMLEELNRTIALLKDRIHGLEIRLTQDEQRFCESCDYKRKFKSEGNHQNATDGNP